MPGGSSSRPLLAGGAPMPELGFAGALYYQVAGDDAGKKAIALALGPSGDLRQLAIVFDWCQGRLPMRSGAT